MALVGTLEIHFTAEFNMAATTVNVNEDVVSVDITIERTLELTQEMTISCFTTDSRL